MNLLKLCAPVGLVVFLAMAMFGPSAAMAESTALCKADENPCTEANRVNHVHYVAEDIEILTSSMDYTCDALILAQALALGSPQVLHGNVTYTSCNQGCFREEISNGFLLEVLRTGNELAEIVGTGLEVLSNCEGVLHCVFSLEGIIGQVSGPLLTGDNDHLTYNQAQLQKVKGFLCPKEAYLDALFEPLEAVYIKS